MEYKIIDDRLEVIDRYVSGKKVLDVGCARFGDVDDEWLHGHIKKLAKEVVGLDINKPVVEELNKKGYNIILGNAETIEISEKFDVIVAGQVVEHLSNPGLFLDNMKKNLKDDGFLIITTPNRTNLFSFLRLLIKGDYAEKYNRPFPDRISYYDVFSLRELVERHGYYIHKTYLVNPKCLRNKLLYPLLRFRPEFAVSIVCVLKTTPKPST